MYKYKFRETLEIEDFLIESLGVDLLIPSSEEVLVFFHNGDRMTVNPRTRDLIWEPIHPGEISTSKLSFRLHQWFGKGIILASKDLTL